MKQNIISLVFGIIALSFALSAVVALSYMQQFFGDSALSQYSFRDPEIISQAAQMGKTIMCAVFAFFGVGCGLTAVLVGRNGTEGSNMRKAGMIMGVTGMVGTVVLLVVSLI